MKKVPVQKSSGIPGYISGGFLKESPGQILDHFFEEMQREILEEALVI